MLTRLAAFFTAASALAATACGLGTTPEPNATFTGEAMTPNEEHRALQPCRHKIIGRGRVLLQVAIDAEGAPTSGKVTVIGGDVASAFVSCVNLRLTSDKYTPRSGATTIGRVVDI